MKKKNGRGKWVKTPSAKVTNGWNYTSTPLPPCLPELQSDLANQMKHTAQGKSRST